MPHPKPAEGNVALISPPEGAVAAAAPAPEADDRWVWFEDEHGERFRVPRSWVQGTPADASNAGGSAEEADPDEAGGIHIKNPTLSRMFEGVRLTSGQASLVPKLQAFLDDDEARIFILRGYAGTGKTFLMKGVVDYLSAVNRSVHLMAPTGRAAKVLSTRTSRSASTIHAHLYSPRDQDDPDDEDFTLVSDLTSNTDELDAVYVVDEASMVSDRETQNPLLQFGSGRLLADLLHFLEDAPCAHRRHILFVGDAAQLPPVGMTVSPALSPVHLEEEFGLKPSEHTLTDIVRQKQDSGILALATALRTGLKNKTYALPRLPADVPDVERIDARDMARLCWEVMGLLLGCRALVGRRSRRLRLDGEGLSRQQRSEVDPVVARHEHHAHDGQPRLPAKRNAAAGAKASRAAHPPAVLDRRAFLKILPAHEKDLPEASNAFRIVARIAKAFRRGSSRRTAPSAERLRTAFGKKYPNVAFRRHLQS